MTASILDLNLFHLGHLEPTAAFKEKRGVMRPYAGADYYLTLSHRRLRRQAFHPNVDKCRRSFPNYSKMSQPIGKGSTGTWKWDEADLMSWNRHFMEHGQTHA